MYAAGDKDVKFYRHLFLAYVALEQQLESLGQRWAAVCHWVEEQWVLLQVKPMHIFITVIMCVFITQTASVPIQAYHPHEEGHVD